LQQGSTNVIEPGKRPLSSMSPTLILRSEKPYLALGSVGGPRIISSVAQVILGVADFGFDIQTAVDHPRVHMQYQPDTLYLEEEFSDETICALRERGWNLVKENHWSISQAVQVDWDKRLFYGAADSRGVGSASGPAPIP